MTDPTNPQHYRQGGIQPIEFIRANKLGFCAGNIIKYVVRAPFKNGVEDLKKARWYLDEYIAELSAEGEAELEIPDFVKRRDT